VAGATHYLEEQVLNALLRSAAAYKPAAIYVVLFFAAPSDAGGGTEVSGGNYAPQQVVQADANWAAPSGDPRTTSNVNVIEWASVTWSGTVNAWGLRDGVAGNLLWWKAAANTVQVGDTMRFNAGALSVQGGP
jgi:hypothetical protein